jgi:D-glycero-alpha-D-manno-heptose-7-phosphate kinase
LGGSSALAIAIAYALNQVGNKLYNIPLLSNDELVRVCRDLEARIIHTPTGVQDYWGAVNGGLNIIEFPPGKTVVSSFHEGIENLGLEKQMLVFYSGQSRASAINNWEIFKRVFDRDPKTIASLENLAACADRAALSLNRGDRKSFFQASKDEWRERVQLWPGVETEQTKVLSELAMDHGAEFVRVCGAGGGGVMVAFCGEADREKLSKALAFKGARILEVSLVKKGVHISEENA